MRWAVIVCFALLTAVAAVATLGVFRGKLVAPPPPHNRPGWIFVQSPKGMVREVEISKAKVVYGDDVPAMGRANSPNADLVPGAEVLVTAEQDDSGAWRATEVEILRLHASRAARRSPSKRCGGRSLAKGAELKG